MFDCFLLQFESPDLLIELSILGGNDFTSHHMRPLRGKVGLGNKPHIAGLADWVRTHGRVDNHAVLAMEIVSTTLLSAI